MGVDPKQYLIRMAEGIWGLFPFTENIASDILREYEPLTLGDALDIVRPCPLLGTSAMDVSVVVDPGPSWGVNWLNGQDVTAKLLLSMNVRIEGM